MIGRILNTIYMYILLYTEKLADLCRLVWQKIADYQPFRELYCQCYIKVMSSLTHFSLTQLASSDTIVSRPKKQKASSGWFIRASTPLKKNLIAGPTIRASDRKAIIAPVHIPMLINLSLFIVLLI